MTTSQTYLVGKLYLILHSNTTRLINMRKQVIIVRKDLGMSLGRLQPKLCMLAIMDMERASKFDMQAVTEWKREG